MRISSKTRYGLRALVQLAECFKGKPVKIEEIAKKQNISEKYLEQIMLQLKKSGFVEGIAGSKGGFILSKNPEEIKVIDIVVALEGDISPVFCVDNPQLCNLSNICSSREVWKGLKEKIYEFLSSIKLSDLIKLSEAKKKEILDYQI
ncbi:MAG: RrF2 family transcriptional regulator [Candidatus Ratteibacteria bacterium]